MLNIPSYLIRTPSISHVIFMFHVIFDAMLHLILCHTLSIHHTFFAHFSLNKEPFFLFKSFFSFCLRNHNNPGEYSDICLCQVSEGFEILFALSVCKKSDVSEVCQFKRFFKGWNISRQMSKGQRLTSVCLIKNGFFFLNFKKKSGMP